MSKNSIKDLEFTEKYVYNKEDDKYVVFLKKAAKPIVIDGDKHRSMMRAYCGPDGRSQQEICSSNAFPSEYFQEYKSIFGWTRDELPLTNEEIEENTVEESVESIIELKKFEIIQELNKREWRETQDQAKKWREFELNTLAPFERVLQKWTPPKRNPLSASKKKATKSGRWFVMTCSDFQIGTEAGERYLYRHKGWDSSKALAALDKLMVKISDDVAEMGMDYEGAYLLLAGDLFHGLKARTEKGTPLQCDLLRDDQCDAILHVLYMIVERLHGIFGKVIIHSVRGNHDGTDFYPIMVALENYFRGERSISFNIHSSRTAAFLINKVGFILDHGASDLYKSKVPKNGKARESYIQSLILADKELLAKAKQVLFVCGDMHSYEQIEFNDFEFIRTGCLPLGDQYADNSNLHSRSRQNCFIVDKTGLKQVIHYYIDEL